MEKNSKRVASAFLLRLFPLFLLWLGGDAKAARLLIVAEALGSQPQLDRCIQPTSA